MRRLFPSTNYLYLHETAIDLHLNPLRKAISSIPKGVLQIEDSCYPIITDYLPIFNSAEEEMNIFLGHGFYPSDFNINYHPGGIVLCLNPPFTHEIKKIQIFNKGNTNINNQASFTIRENRFTLTGQELNLDEVICDGLLTGMKYEKPKQLRCHTYF